MSYVIHIWESPKPASVADAVRFLDSHASDRVGQNPKFIELAKALTAGFPCITTLAADDPTAVWTDGPLDGVTDERCYTVGIARHHWVVRDHIFSSASRLGLTCFDEQEGIVFLPGRLILPEGTRLPDRPPYALTDEDLLCEFERIVQPAGFGAVEGDSSHQKSRIRDGCKQTIWFCSLNRYGQLEFELIVQTAWIHHPISLEFTPEFFTDETAKFYAWNSEDAGSALAEMKQFILRTVIPFLDRTSTLENLDQFINNPLRSFTGLRRNWRETYLSGLYVARKVGNPRFNELVHAYSTRTRGYDYGCAWLATQRWAALLLQEPEPLYPSLDEVLSNSAQELREFVDTYDGARLREIDFTPNGRRGIGAVDRNLGYRRSVSALILKELDTAPIPLLIDLLIAESRWARDQLWVDRCVAPVAQALLARIGKAAFDAFGLAMACGANILDAIKTIDVMPSQAPSLAVACRDWAAGAGSAKMKMRWLDWGRFFDQVHCETEETDIAAFAACYEPSQRFRIAFRWNGVLPSRDQTKLGKDLNFAFRERVRKYVINQPDTVPIALLGDLFAAEWSHRRHADTLIRSFYAQEPHAMLTAQAMLVHGGARELELFEMAQVDALHFWYPFDRMALPGEKGPALAAMCRERSALAACPERKFTYLKMAQFFAQIPSEVPPGHLYNYSWRPKIAV